MPLRSGTSRPQNRNPSPSRDRRSSNTRSSSSSLTLSLAPPAPARLCLRSDAVAERHLSATEPESVALARQAFVEHALEQLVAHPVARSAGARAALPPI